MQFPRLVYKNAAVHALVNDELEHLAHIAAGWFASVPEALDVAQRIVPPWPQVKLPPAPIDPEPATEPELVTLLAHEEVDNAPPTRDELKQKATELGLMFARNVANEKLAEMIADALKGAGV